MKEQLQLIRRRMKILKWFTYYAIVLMVVINILLWGKFMGAYNCLLLGSMVLFMYILIQRAELIQYLKVIALYENLTEEQVTEIEELNKYRYELCFKIINNK
jgi:hypothetical protein